MRNIDSLLLEYGESHQNKTNKLIHWFCVPAIFFSVVGLVFSIPSGFLADLLPFLGNYANWATLTLVLMLIYYISLSPALTLAWIVQFYGHKIEGKKPSFLKDIQFLMIGPAWLMHFIYKKIGIAY